MNSIIFKSEKKAKSYEVRATEDFHIYAKGELIFKVRTDDISRIAQDYPQNKITVNQI